jgi:hypothetical protein
VSWALILIYPAIAGLEALVLFIIIQFFGTPLLALLWRWMLLAAPGFRGVMQQYGLAPDASVEALASAIRKGTENAPPGSSRRVA